MSKGASKRSRRAYAEQRAIEKARPRNKGRAAAILAIREYQKKLLDKLRHESATIPSPDEGVCDEPILRGGDVTQQSKLESKSELRDSNAAYGSVKGIE